MAEIPIDQFKRVTTSLKQPTVMKTSTTELHTKSGSRSTLLLLDNSESGRDQRTSIQLHSWAHALTHRYASTWWSEASSVLFSLTTSAAIVIVLIVYDGKAAPNLVLGLTLDTIVSILVTSS